MADWDEIKRLAADFQRVQVTSTAHKLSERNCVEIVQKLISLNLLEVIYTTDGKEYLTPQQLEKEIKDELFIRGGRINLVDIQQAINVDLSHIENKVGEILRHDNNLLLIQGDLIEREYLDRMAEEINDTLQESGQVFVSEFCKTFTLPTDFVLEVVESSLGTIIQGQLDQMDRNVLFTHAFVARQTARIRGVLTAITRPTQLSSLIGHYRFQEELFYSVISDLLASQRIAGSTQGRQDKVSFIPDIYTHSQNKWVDDFLKQNGYIEYDALTRMGVSDGKQYLKKRYRDNKLFLPTCCVGQLVRDNVHAAIDEGVATVGWIDVTVSMGQSPDGVRHRVLNRRMAARSIYGYAGDFGPDTAIRDLQLIRKLGKSRKGEPLLPSPFTPEDANHFLQNYLKTSGRTTAQILCDSYVASESFIDACREPFNELMQKKAEKDAVESPALLSELSKRDMANLKGGASAVDRRETKKEERRKTASSGSKGGGGAGGRGGRETKTKKVKDKRFKGGKTDDPGEDEYADKSTNPEELQFMNVEEITKILQKNNPDCDEVLVTELAEQLHRPLTRTYQQVVRTVFQTSGDKKRKSHSEVQEKVNTLIASAKLFDKGIKLFDDDVQVHLSRHLLRTVCTDIVNLIVNMLAADQMLAVTDQSSLSPEKRMKIISKMPEQVNSSLAKLNSSLNAKETSDFFNQFEVVSGPDLCEFMIKKLDKKKEKQITIEHRAALQEQLRQEDEPAMALHLAAVLLFQHFTSTPIHAPGRCVPQIISSLASHLTPEQHETLTQYQSLVVKRLTGGPVTDENEPGEEEAGEKSAATLLEEKLQEIKDMALNIKKSNHKEEK